MHSPSTTEEFSDLGSHQYMWKTFTGMMLKGIIGVVVIVLFLGWITGVL
jgi:hypothetical protein